MKTTATALKQSAPLQVMATIMEMVTAGMETASEMDIALDTLQVAGIATAHAMEMVMVMVSVTLAAVALAVVITSAVSIIRSMDLVDDVKRNVCDYNYWHWRIVTLEVT